MSSLASIAPGTWIATGALVCALSVAAGAFGAHALAARLEPRALELWETAARYLVYGGFGTLLAGLAQAAAVGRGAPAGALGAAALCLAAGGLVFGGTVFALALGGPRWLGAVTPLGGTLLIVGFVLLAVGAAGRL